MILTRQNLADPQNLADCRAQFFKASTCWGPDRPIKLAEWALNWGEAAIDQLENAAADIADGVIALKARIEEIKDDHRAHLSEITDAHAEASHAIRDIEKAIER